jgi:hypothetical protein
MFCAGLFSICRSFSCTASIGFYQGIQLVLLANLAFIVSLSGSSRQKAPAPASITGC